MMIDISVIVPIYNAEPYLDQCIECILGQTFTNFELILVNDGSKDGSDEICKKFAEKDKRIIYITKSNGGSASAKNAGLNIARGKFIEFVDADDTIDNTYIENLFKGTVDEEVDLCVGNVAFIKKEHNNFKRKEVSVYPGIFILQEYLKYYSLYMPNAIIGAPWNKLYKREIIEKNKLYFDTNLKNNEDTQFNYLYLEKCRKIYVSDSPYYNYVDWGHKSASKGYIEDIFDIYLSTYKKAQDFLKRVGMYDYNEEFTKKYFINLVIGAINNIVIWSPFDSSKKKKMIKNIVYNQAVQTASSDLQYPSMKKKILLWLIQKKKVHLLYGLFVLNKIRGTKV